MSALKRRVDRIAGKVEKKSGNTNYTMIFVEDGETNEEAIVRAGKQNADKDRLFLIRFIAST